MKRVRLSKRSAVEFSALVDDGDFDLVSRHTWTLSECPAGYPCAIATIDGRQVRMHRLLTGAETGADVDHINGDRLDNRRSNLRVVTHAANLWNSVFPLGQSGFRGVCLTRNGKRWRAQIRHNGRELHLGTFDSPCEAASAYDAAVAKYRDEYATLSDGVRTAARREAERKVRRQFA